MSFALLSMSCLLLKVIKLLFATWAAIVCLHIRPSVCSVALLVLGHLISLHSFVAAVASEPEANERGSSLISIGACNQIFLVQINSSLFSS